MATFPAHCDRNHPVIKGEYAIHTPAANKLGEILGQWIDHKITGGIIYGPSRHGKTSICEYFLREELTERYGKDFPISIWKCTEEDSASRDAFYVGLLRGFGYKLSEDVKRGKSLHAIVEFLIGLTTLSNSNYVVIVIDEAQDMRLRQWNLIKDLANKLKGEGIQLSVFAIEAHQMAYQFRMLGEVDDAHLALRFFAADWRFPGIECVEDVEYLLRGYDEMSEWPMPNGVSYLAYFAPIDFQQGRRLSRCAADVWSVLISLLPKDFKGVRSFPMLHFSKAVEEVLASLAAGAAWIECTSPEGWKMAFRANPLNLTSHMHLIGLGSKGE